MASPRGQNAVVSAAGDTIVGNTLPPLAREQVPCSDTLPLLAILAADPLTCCCCKQKLRECTLRMLEHSCYYCCCWIQDIGGFPCQQFIVLFPETKSNGSSLSPLCTVFSQGFSLEDSNIKPISNESRQYSWLASISPLAQRRVQKDNDETESSVTSTTHNETALNVIANKLYPCVFT